MEYGTLPSGRPTLAEALSAVSEAEIPEGSEVARVQVKILETGEVAYRLFGPTDDELAGNVVLPLPY